MRVTRVRQIFIEIMIFGLAYIKINRVNIELVDKYALVE